MKNIFRRLPVYVPSFVILAVLTAAAPVPAAAQTPPHVQETAAAMGKMAANQHRPVLTVSFGSFTYEYSGIGGPFSRFLEEILSDAITRTNGKVSLFVLNALSNLDPEFKEGFAGLFNLEGVEAVMSGKYFDAGDSVRVRLEMVDFTNGALIGREEIAVPKSAVPESVSLLPPNLEEAARVFHEIGDIVKSGDERIVVKATTNRGNGAVFRDGEELVVNFFSSRDAYIKIYHIDVRGETNLIFPNRFHANNFVSRNTLVRIPGPGHPFSFVLGEPYGTEFIKVVASTAQFRIVEESFSDLGRYSSGLVVRGLTVKQREGDLAESLINFTIVR